MINATLNPAGFADSLCSEGRLQIREFLHPEVAERLHECLQREVPWGLAYRDGNTSTVVPTEKLAEFSDNDWAQITNRMYALATKDFQFAYNSYMMITAYRDRRDLHSTPVEPHPSP